MQTPAFMIRAEGARDPDHQATPLMRSRMLPFALVLSGAIHAAVIGISHDVVPKLTADSSFVYTTQLDAVLIDIAQDKGETPLPSQAAAESVASAGEQNPQDDLEQGLERLEQLSASLEKQLKEAQAERRAEAIRYEAHIDALLEQNTLTQQDSQRLTTALAEQKSTVTKLRTTVQQLSQDLDLEKNATRQLQASQLKHQSDLIDLQTEKELVTSQNQQLTDRLTQTQSAYEDSAAQLHDTASRLAETRSENQKLALALASSEKTALDLKDELAQVINEATLERQTMAQGQKAVEDILRRSRSNLTPSAHQTNACKSKRSDLIKPLLRSESTSKTTKRPIRKQTPVLRMRNLLFARPRKKMTRFDASYHTSERTRPILKSSLIRRRRQKLPWIPVMP